MLVNNTYLRYKEYDTINKVLSSNIDSVTSLIVVYKHKDSLINEELSIKNNSISERDSIITKAIINDNKQQKQIKKLNTCNKILQIGFVTTTITTILLLIL